MGNARTCSKRKKRPRMTQAERLRIARQTEKENAKSLAAMLKIEEKQKRVVKKVRTITGATISTYTGPKSNGGTFVSFKQCGPLVRFKFPTPPKERPPGICQISKRNARYIYPITGQPFYDLASFKALRKSKKLKTK